MIYIRADGNTEIGMGHVMRCLSVAEAVADAKTQDIVFITADEGCRAMIVDRGFRVIVLDTDYRDMMSELPMLADLLHKGQDVVLVDSYQVSSAYFLALGMLAVTACFEDMGQSWPVDLLINYNIYAPELAGHYKGLRRVLLGVEYMPLRKAFQKPSEYIVRDKVTNVTVTTGGSDPYFAAGAFADAFLNDSFMAGEGIRLNLISGPFNKYADELKRRYSVCRNVTIHENVRDMRSLLLESDVVISATGSTIYEVSTLGVPMIVFYFAENQRQGAEALEHLTDIVNAGCFADDSRSVACRVVETLKKCICSKEYRELLCRQEKGLIDGKGALRIAGQLEELHNGVNKGTDRME